MISQRTAEKHVASCLPKLGFASRAQLASWAVQVGLAAVSIGRKAAVSAIPLPNRFCGLDLEGLELRSNNRRMLGHFLIAPRKQGLELGAGVPPRATG